MKLPIDIVSPLYSAALKFRWTQTVDTMNGMVTQECEGPIPPSVERAVADLIAMTKQLAIENNELRSKVTALQNRAPTTTATTMPVSTPQSAPTGGKLGRR